MPRLAIGCLSLFLMSPAGAQSTSDLIAKFGPPTLERYRVPPNIELTVTYGEHRAACELLFEAALHGQPAVMSGALIDRLLNEFAPPDTRIGPALGMFEQMSCAARESREYRNVRIGRGTNECVPDKRTNVTSLSIQWKRPECPH